MRLWIFALFLSAGTLAVCQSAAPPPANPSEPRQIPHVFSWPGTDFSKMPPSWLANSVPLQSLFVRRDPGPAARVDHSQIDPMMIIHPLKSRVGTPPLGTLVAQNEYPGLQFLPIEISSVKLEPIPIPWPDLKLQSIPTVAAKAKLVPVESQLPVTPSAGPK